MKSILNLKKYVALSIICMVIFSFFHIQGHRSRGRRGGLFGGALYNRSGVNSPVFRSRAGGVPIRRARRPVDAVKKPLLDRNVKYTFGFRGFVPNTIDLGLITVLKENDAKMISLTSGRGGGNVLPYSFLSNGKQIIFLTKKGEVNIYDLMSQEVIKTGQRLEIERGAIVLFSPDGRHYAIVYPAPKNNAIVIKNILSGNVIQKFHLEPVIKKRSRVKRRLMPIAFSPDGLYLGALAKNVVRVWDVQTGKVVFEKENDTPVKLISLSNGADRIAIIADDEETCKVWGKSGELVNTFMTNAFFGSIALTYDGKYLAVQGVQNSYKSNRFLLYEVEVGKTEIEKYIFKPFKGLTCKPPIFKKGKKIKDSDEPERREYWQTELQEKESAVIPQKMKVKVKMHGKEFYIPRLPL